MGGREVVICLGMAQAVHGHLCSAGGPLACMDCMHDDTRQRALNPQVSKILPRPHFLCIRYEFKFLGLLESPADGLGAWGLPGVTLAGLVTNATFPSFLKVGSWEWGGHHGKSWANIFGKLVALPSSLWQLCSGGYGNKVLEPGHAVMGMPPPAPPPYGSSAAGGTGTRCWSRATP